MRTLALPILAFLALAAAACESAPPTAGIVETGAPPHPYVHSGPGARPDAHAHTGACAHARTSSR